MWNKFGSEGAHEEAIALIQVSGMLACTGVMEVGRSNIYGFKK